MLHLSCLNRSAGATCEARQHISDSILERVYFCEARTVRYSSSTQRIYGSSRAAQQPGTRSQFANQHANVSAVLLTQPLRRVGVYKQLPSASQEQHPSVSCVSSDRQLSASWCRLRTINRPGIARRSSPESPDRSCRRPTVCSHASLSSCSWRDRAKSGDMAPPFCRKTCTCTGRRTCKRRRGLRGNPARA